MAKFKLDEIVSYCGKNAYLKNYFKDGMMVVDIIPDGFPIGNGEVNKSGQNVYIVIHNGMRFFFKESDLTSSIHGTSTE